jgi:hypothetical protein
MRAVDCLPIAFIALIIVAMEANDHAAPEEDARAGAGSGQVSFRHARAPAGRLIAK